MNSLKVCWLSRGTTIVTLHCFIFPETEEKEKKKINKIKLKIGKKKKTIKYANVGEACNKLFKRCIVLSWLTLIRYVARFIFLFFLLTLNRLTLRRIITLSLNSLSRYLSHDTFYFFPLNFFVLYLHDHYLVSDKIITDLKKKLYFKLHICVKNKKITANTNLKEILFWPFHFHFFAICLERIFFPFCDGNCFLVY